jgi:hypothetical protein
MRELEAKHPILWTGGEFNPSWGSGPPLLHIQVYNRQRHLDK